MNSAGSRRAVCCEKESHEFCERVGYFLLWIHSIKELIYRCPICIRNYSRFDLNDWVVISQSSRRLADFLGLQAERHTILSSLYNLCVYTYCASLAPHSITTNRSQHHHLQSRCCCWMLQDFNWWVALVLVCRLTRRMNLFCKIPQ